MSSSVVGFWRAGLLFIESLLRSGLHRRSGVSPENMISKRRSRNSHMRALDDMDRTLDQTESPKARTIISPELSRLNSATALTSFYP
jgi:hypothetical protein